MLVSCQITTLVHQAINQGYTEGEGIVLKSDKPEDTNEGRCRETEYRMCLG